MMSAASTTGALMINLFFQSPVATTNNGTAQKNERYSGFTRSQHATPSTAPEARANQRLCRLIAISKSHNAPHTNHAVGASADGETPTMANKGDSAANTLAIMPARHPYAVTAIPVISVNENSPSRTASTFCTAYAERSPVSQ